MWESRISASQALLFIAIRAQSLATTWRVEGHFRARRASIPRAMSSEGVNVADRRERAARAAELRIQQAVASREQSDRVSVRGVDTITRTVHFPGALGKRRAPSEEDGMDSECKLLGLEQADTARLRAIEELAPTDASGGPRKRGRHADAKEAPVSSALISVVTRP